MISQEVVFYTTPSGIEVIDATDYASDRKYAQDRYERRYKRETKQKNKSSFAQILKECATKLHK